METQELVRRGYSFGSACCSGGEDFSLDAAAAFASMAEHFEDVARAGREADAEDRDGHYSEMGLYAYGPDQEEPVWVFAPAGVKRYDYDTMSQVAAAYRAAAGKWERF